MSERLSAADVAFLQSERRSTPQHVSGLATFDPPPGGFDYERLLALLEERISLVPRYRQKLRAVPFALGNPVWIDDPGFDITYHVRRSALPQPGTEDALLDLCARIQQRLLDRSRPLWEIYLVEGLSDGRLAILTKTHKSMIDGAAAIDIGQVLLDAAPAPRRTVGSLWMPAPEPGPARLIGDALLATARHPTELVRIPAPRELRAGVRRVTEGAATVAGLMAGALHVTHPSPLSAAPGEHRRLALARADLADVRRVRNGLGGSVNDTILAVVAGALRRWLLARGEVLQPTAAVRALVPVSIAPDVSAGGASAGGASAAADAAVASLLVDLPVGDPDPAMRLARIRQDLARQLSAQVPRRGGSAYHPVGAGVLMSLSGFAPPTLHALGARAAHGLARRAYALTVTNVPGPQYAMYAAGARMREMYPFLPLDKGQALSVAMTSYDGWVYFGFSGDRDALPDVATIAGFVPASLAELVDIGAGSLGALDGAGAKSPRSAPARTRGGGPSGVQSAGSGAGSFRAGSSRAGSRSGSSAAAAPATPSPAQRLGAAAEARPKHPRHTRSEPRQRTSRDHS